MRHLELGKSKIGRAMHYSVGAIIVKDDKILLIDRAKPPFGYACPAGHVERGEEIVPALFREVEEETGLHVEEHELLFEEEVDWNWCSLDITSHYWYVYKCSATGTLSRNYIETKSIGWYTPEQIKKLNMEPVWKYWLERFKVL